MRHAWPRLIQPPRVAAQPLIDAGRLREVLPRWRPDAIAVSAVYVKRPHVSPGVRAFVDWIAERFEAAVSGHAGLITARVWRPTVGAADRVDQVDAQMAAA